MLNTPANRRSSGRVYVRFFTVLALAAILTPLMVIDREQRASASPPVPSVAAPPNNTPPQPFKMGTAQAPTFSVSFAVTLSNWLGTVIGIDKEIEPAESATRFDLKRTFGKIESNHSTVEPAEPAPAPQPAGSVDFDFDGDGKSDVGRWHPQTAEFKVKNSNGGSYSTWTLGSAPSYGKPAPADYDGDGKTDAAIFSSGTWTIRKSSDGNTTTISSFGQSGDIPASGDYYGGSADELAYYRPSNGTWYYREFSNSTVYTQSFGDSADIPAPGDFNADGKMDFVVFRPSNGVWYVQYNGGSWVAYSWGMSGDVPVPGDFDGDGKADIAIWRPTNGQWWILFSAANYTTYIGGAWGNFGDQPVAGDYDGDNKADWMVWRPSSGKSFVTKSSGGSDSVVLGIAGDTAVLSSYVKQTGAQIAADVINKERLKPGNATGGTDLYSQNFSWGGNLVSLPGRSGMDLNIGLSYNSLVWTKVGSTMLFNPDANTAISPGFNIGFPTIEPAYYNDDTDKFNYLMVTPSGSRVEFRQTGASNVYETYDSSYSQLVTTGASSPNDPVENITIKVTSTDGTQMSYEWYAGAFRCKKITDRNGNYISITYDPVDIGVIDTITDTLGRVLQFNYDSVANLTSITQTWKDNNGGGSNTTHTWATLSYTTKTINTDFDSSLAMWGAYNGMDLKVLDKVAYADGSFTKFYYSDYGQVYKIENHAADSATGTPHVLNYVRTNLESPGADQTNVPRFSQVWNKVENFNSGNETTTTISRLTGQSYTSPGGGTVTATKIEVAMTGDPYNSVSKSWYGESGWKDGLPLATEDWADGTSGSERKRWTWTGWEQDQIGSTPFTYVRNPRVIETRVGDDVNVKRTTINYLLPSYSQNNISTYGLVDTVSVYANDLSTVIKHVDYDYNLSSTYTDRRIIGLPSKTEAWGWNDISNSLEYVSKVTYAYDESDFSDGSLGQNISPVQHDNTNYGSSFVYRGNLTGVTRWDATQPTTSAAAITSSTKYNTAGSPVAQITPWDGTNTRTIRIGYADNFNSSVGVSTYAYRTVITDPAGTYLGDPDHSSTVKYRYDIGANVEAISPAPADNTYGKTSKRIYDGVGRLERDSIYVNTTENSYVRYEFPTNGVLSKTYAPVVDQDGDGNIAEDEVYSESWYDGAGRTRMSRIEHPGSTGGWAAALVEYDILGRVSRQSVPTETNSSYQPAGDDATRGFLWTYQKYDWKGRLVRKINTDGIDQTTLNDSDVLISYEGCGCAGGQVTSIEGELVPRTDTTGNARRKQKIYEDILGRSFKSETFEWDGTTVYSTVQQSFNGRDQALLIRQYAGSTSSTTYQDTTATFDGHGRLASSHRPEQRDSNNNLKYTTYNYNPDDSILNVTDGRGAVTSLEYNSRGLLTEKSWTVPTGSGIADPADVTFSYDNLGNRTQMTDGLGIVEYAYDSLSQMLSESRNFTATLSNEPSSGVFKLEYSYNLSGDLKTLKDPYGQQFNYTRDKKGRLLSVTGSTAFAGLTNYASSPGYNARGQLIALQYGNGVQMNIGGINNKLQATEYELKKGTTTYLDKTYQFYGDGNLKFAEDNLIERFDRLYKYDQLGRTVEGLSGAPARGAMDDAINIPYTQAFTYNAFGQVTQLNMTHFNGYPDSSARSYANNRAAYSDYDNDGNEIEDENAEYKFDGAGLKVATAFKDPEDPETPGVARPVYYDGDGKEVKREAAPTNPEGSVNRYFIRSTVLNKVISEAFGDGSKWKTYVPANGLTLAYQQYGWNGYVREERTYFLHQDVSGTTLFETEEDGDPKASWQGYREAEYDSLGNDVGAVSPYLAEPPPDPPMQDIFNLGFGDSPYGGGGTPGPVSRMYLVDGMRVSESYFMDQINSGLIGGAFGLLEMSARMSVRDYSVRARGENGRIYERFYATAEEAGRVARSFGQGTIYRNILVNDSWTIGGVQGQWYYDDLAQRLLDAAKFIDKYVKFFKNGDGQHFEKQENQEAIRRSLIWVIASPECAKAFKDAKLTTPEEEIKRRGLILAGAGVLLNPKITATLGISESTRTNALKHLTVDIQAFTGDNKEGPIFTFFANTAFNGSSWLAGYYSLQDVVVHETIHEVGVGRHTSFFGGHDLSGYEHYDKILENCKIGS